MFAKLLPKQEAFFELFGKTASCVTAASYGLYEQLQQLSSPQAPADQILHYKKMANAHAQRLFTLMHKTFITPFDRYDIHRLNDKLYDIANMINLTAQRIIRYEILVAPPMMIKLAEICYKSTQLLEEVISQLHDLRNNGNITKACDQIKAFESHADQLLIDGMANLLREEPDLKNIFKLKEVYELLESITDRCQEVAFIVEGIVLEYA
jgi:uncharacterized protein Yka (UPF0111/DUF47 family)